MIERRQHAPEQRGERLGVGTGELSQDRAFVREQVDQGSVDAAGSGVGELDHHAAPVVERGVTFDQTPSCQAVDAVGHGSRRHQGLLQQTPWGEPIGLARTAKGGENVELPAFQAVTTEGLTAGAVQVTCEPSHSTQHLEWGDVEVGAFTPPRRNEIVDLVASYWRPAVGCHGLVSTPNQLLTRSSMQWSYSACVVLTELQ